jgi:hypothetical protein
MGGRGKLFTGLWYENLRERDYCGDPGVDGRKIVMRIFGKWDVLSWYRIETGGGHL